MSHCSTSKLIDMANRHAENYRTDLIRTHWGDTLYPWPAGKAPWSIEQGGNGIAPTGARGTARNPAQGSENVSEEIEKYVPLPAIETMGEVNKDTVEQFVDYAMAVAKKITKYHEKNAIDGPQKDLVRILNRSLMKNMEELKDHVEKKSGSTFASSLALKEERI